MYNIHYLLLIVRLEKNNNLMLLEIPWKLPNYINSYTEVIKVDCKMRGMILPSKYS